MLDSFSLATHQGDHDPLKGLPSAALKVGLDMAELAPLSLLQSVLNALSGRQTVGGGVQSTAQNPASVQGYGSMAAVGSSQWPKQARLRPTTVPAPALAPKSVPTPAPNNVAGNAGNVVNASQTGPVTSQGTANAATASKLTEQLTSESLIASGTNIKDIKVIAKGRIEGRVYIDTNQAARAQQAANSAEKTLVPTERIFDVNRFSMHGNVNGNMATAHAEIGVIQQASNAGITKGADMTLSIQGKAVCQFCRGDIPAAAQNAGLKSLTIINETTGVTWYWNPGMRNLKVKK